MMREMSLSKELIAVMTTKMRMMMIQKKK